MTESLITRGSAVARALHGIGAHRFAFVVEELVREVQPRPTVPVHGSETKPPPPPPARSSAPDLTIATGWATLPDGELRKLVAGPALGASASDLRRQAKRLGAAEVTQIRRRVLLKRTEYDHKLAAGESREQIIESVQHKEST